MTTDTYETLRECIERGGRGEFARALVELYENEDVLHGFTRAFDRAWVVADSDNRTRLESAWRSHSPLRRALCDYFPALAHLDEPCDNPHAVFTEWHGESGDVGRRTGGNCH
jgi:hypothetical protein